MDHLAFVRKPEYLNKITTEWHGVSLADVKDISQNPDAIICYSCVQKLVKCDKIEKELHKLTQDFVQCLGKLLNVTAGTIDTILNICIVSMLELMRQVKGDQKEVHPSQLIDELIKY